MFDLIDDLLERREHRGYKRRRGLRGLLARLRGDDGTYARGEGRYERRYRDDDDDDDHYPAHADAAQYGRRRRRHDDDD